MRLHCYGSAAAFLAAAGAFLIAREAEHNLPLGIVGTLRDHPEVYPEPAHLIAVSDGGRTVLAAVRTPPFNLVLSETDDLGALDLLVAELVSGDPTLPGVLGPAAVARRFAELWMARTGRRASRSAAERIYRLTRVVPPAAPPRGTWRLAAEADRLVLRDWLDSFRREALPGDAPVPDPDAMVDRWIRRVGRTMHLWEVGGRAVSMVGAGSPTPHGVRIGPVYTPPADRGQGFATALTAAVSQDQLDAGRRFCFLFTDLANPTSNRIYQAIGYEPVADVDAFRFEVRDSRP